MNHVWAAGTLANKESLAATWAKLSVRSGGGGGAACCLWPLPAEPNTCAALLPVRHALLLDTTPAQASATAWAGVPKERAYAKPTNTLPPIKLPMVVGMRLRPTKVPVRATTRRC